MRHRKKRSKLGMMTSHRKATLRNISKGLLKHQRITITLARAKDVRRLVEHLITLSKTDTVTSRRRAFAILTDRDLVHLLFTEIAPLFKNRSSGYTRIIPVGFRRGDGANLCILELTEKKIVEKLPKKKKEKEAKEEGKKSAPQDKEKPEAEGAKHAKEEHKKEAKKLETERMSEKVKVESKKVADKKGFMKNLRGLFRKRGDF